MGVYIKGMEMPEMCLVCPMFEGGWQRCRVLERDTTIVRRHPNCPLVEIPKHGALIDMDDFLSEWSELESYRTAMSLCEIIPAEEGE